MKLLSKGTALASIVAAAFLLSAAASPAAENDNPNRVNILYVAFGKNPLMKKDWGFSAFIELNGKRILFDTGNDSASFAANVEAKGSTFELDFVILSHRHSDHMAGVAMYWP